MNNDFLIFFKQWLRSPKDVGSIAPSSQKLRRKIGEIVDIHIDQHQIVEVGPGTGVFTFLLENIANKTPHPLIVVEINTHFYGRLKPLLQNETILINESISKVPLDEKEPILLVSSIPFKSIPDSVTEKIYFKYIDILRGNLNSHIFQYSYGLKAPAIATSLQKNLRWIQIDKVYGNLPPAIIWELVLSEEQST